MSLANRFVRFWNWLATPPPETIRTTPPPPAVAIPLTLSPADADADAHRFTSQLSQLRLSLHHANRMVVERELQR